MTNKLHPVLVAICLLACISLIQAHTWVEQLSVIASNGTFVGTPGYPRGFVVRAAGVDPDAGMTYLLPPNGRSTGNAVLSTDLMCKGSQTIGTQTPGSPALIASAGDHVALRYQENGHVTQPTIPPGKPAGSGTVFVYGTTQPSNSDTFLGIHKVWNEDGTGGDGRGILLATRHFDDGQCYQINGGPISQTRQKEFPHTANALMGQDMWCQTDVQLPVNAKGTYTLYWVWDWPTLAGTPGLPNGLNQSYTTCMDISLTPNNARVKAANGAGASYVQGQNIDNAAIAAQLATPFLVNPSAPFQPYSGGSTVATSASSLAQTAASFITVTVTASPNPQVQMVTVTETLYVTEAGTKPTRSRTHKQHATSSTSSVAASSPEASGKAPAGPPAVQPFLPSQSNVSQPVVAAAAASSIVSSAITTTATSSDCPAMTTTSAARRRRKLRRRT